MSAVEEYLRELDGQLRVRGRARRRLLAECRDHLQDASAVHGEREAVDRFGAAAELAASFDAEIAARRANRATIACLGAVLALAGSTLALLHAADANASGTVLWAVVFFGSAQAAGVSALLAALQAAASRNRPTTPSDVALLCRRNAYALGFAALTLVSAGGAVPGHASAAVLLAGPAAAAVAGLLVLRARALARHRDSSGERVLRSPVADLTAVLRLPGADVSPARLLVPSTAIMAIGAFFWGRGEQGTVGTALTAAAIEAALIIVGFVAFGPALGLRPNRRHRRTVAR